MSGGRAAGVLAGVLVAAAVATAPARAAEPGPAPAAQRPAPGGQPALTAVIVRLNAPLGDPAPRERSAGAVAARLEADADRVQAPVLRVLRRRRRENRAAGIVPLWIAGAIAVRADPGVVRELAGRPDVLSVAPDATVPAPPPSPAPAAWNLQAIGAPALWAAGAEGQGATVASLDSGVDLTNPALGSRWRGGTNSWFDPYGEHASPVDVGGHGTWTTGVMVGGSGAGVAPSARWIAARAFPDRGAASASQIHRAFQWLLDPDGDPTTADAPDVVLGAWGAPGCSQEFQPDLDALRSAGILPVFAAGNDGPAAGTGESPGNLPGAFSVGATDSTDAIASFSSRGPSTCAGRSRPFPDIVAPGVGISTTDLEPVGITTASGTSLAAPHVAGAAALLLSAKPHLSVDGLEAALRSGATDLGVPGADDLFGAGRLDVAKAWTALGSPAPPVPPGAGPDPPVPPAPSPSPSPSAPAAAADSDPPVPPPPAGAGDAAPQEAPATVSGASPATRAAVTRRRRRARPARCSSGLSRRTAARRARPAARARTAVRARCRTVGRPARARRSAARLRRARSPAAAAAARGRRRAPRAAPARGAR